MTLPHDTSNSSSPNDLNSDNGLWLYWDEPAVITPKDSSIKNMKIEHDEELLETLYWEFDNSRNKKGESERLAFKGKLRHYATQLVLSQQESEMPINRKML